MHTGMKKCGCLMLSLVLILWVFTNATAANQKSQDGQKVTEYHVPYRILVGGHIIVRVKLNGEGPFFFILDTSAK